MTLSPSSTSGRATTECRYDGRLDPQALGSPLPGVVGVRALVQIAILAGLLVTVYWPAIKSTLVYRWINDGTWSYGWLVPLLSVYFLSSRRDALARAARRTNYLGLLVLLGSLACYFVTIWVYRFSYPRALSLIGCVFGLTLFLAGWEVVRVAWFSIVFLVFAVPLPQSLYVKLTMPLQMLAAHVTASVLSLLPTVQTEISGVVIDYSFGDTYGHLNVEQACSGMRSMMAIVTLGIAVAYLGDRRGWQRVVVVVTCVPIAMLCNIIRVTITGLLYVFKDSPAGRSLHLGWFTGPTPHAILGLLTFLLALGLFFVVVWIVGHLFVEELDPAGAEVRPSS